jgi:hypothetical protein
MTSVLRRYDQISPRIRYFLVTVDPADAPDSSGNLSSPEVFAFDVSQGLLDPVTMVADISLNDLTPGAPPVAVDLTVGELYRDLGRSIYVINPLGAGGLQVAIFRQVMPVSGSISEGIPADVTNSRYIKVWAANGGGVYVTRTG